MTVPVVQISITLQYTLNPYYISLANDVMNIFSLNPLQTNSYTNVIKCQCYASFSGPFLVKDKEQSTGKGNCLYRNIISVSNNNQQNQ